MKTKRIAPGIYDVQHAGTKYELERYPDGAWLLFESGAHGREYMQDFATKAKALASLAG
jgi:hypothetical protein